MFINARNVGCTLKCSTTSQDSKVEKRRHVAMPPKMLPSISTLYCGKCLVIFSSRCLSHTMWHLLSFAHYIRYIINNINQMLQDQWSSRMWTFLIWNHIPTMGPMQTSQNHPNNFWANMWEFRWICTSSIPYSRKWAF